MEGSRTRMGNRLKSLRIDKGWDQERLARESGVSLGTVAKFEIGQNGIRFDTAVKLADALGCTLDELACRG